MKATINKQLTNCLGCLSGSFLEHCWLLIITPLNLLSWTASSKAKCSFLGTKASRQRFCLFWLTDFRGWIQLQEKLRIRNVLKVMKRQHSTGQREILRQCCVDTDILWWSGGLSKKIQESSKGQQVSNSSNFYQHVLELFIWRKKSINTTRPICLNICESLKSL